MKDQAPSRSPRRRVLHIVTTFSTSSGAAENTRLTLNSLPRDQFEVFLALARRQSMEPLLATDVTRLTVRHLVRPVRPWLDAAAFIQIYRLCRRWRFDVVRGQGDPLALPWQPTSLASRSSFIRFTISRSERRGIPT